MTASRGTWRLGVSLLGSAAIMALLVSACGDEPRSTIPTLPDAPTVSSVEIGGPAALAPNQSAQFTVTLRMADGTTKLVTPAQNPRWRVGNLSYLRVDTDGIVTALPTLGEATVSVDVTVLGQPRTATREVVVVPAGTFRMVGSIAEAGSPASTIPGARIEINPGGLTTSSDSTGQYRVYGVPPNAIVRVTAPGYLPLEQDLSLATHATQNFRLDLDGPRAIASGPYTLAIDTAGCTGSRPLAAELQQRRYDAVLTQQGPVVEVTLTEPRFRVNTIGRGNKFTGRAVGGAVIFALRRFQAYYYFYSPSGYPDVAEQLSNGTIVVVEGDVTTTLSGATLSGWLNGGVMHWDTGFPLGFRSLGRCDGSGHQFTLSPR